MDDPGLAPPLAPDLPPIRRIAISIAVLLAAVGCSSSPKRPAATPPATENPEVSMGDEASFYFRATAQRSDGETVAIDEVIFSGGRGYVALYADAGGKPGDFLGASALLPAGESRGVRVRLTRRLTRTTYVWPRLHLEDNNNSSFDYPPADRPVKVNGQDVAAQIRIDVG